MRVKKPGLHTVHAGAEAWDGLHPYCDTDSKGWKITTEAAVNCKRCLRIMEREGIVDGWQEPVEDLYREVIHMERERE